MKATDLTPDEIWVYAPLYSGERKSALIKEEA